MVDQFKTFGHQRGCVLGDENLNQTGISTNPLRTRSDNMKAAFGELLVGQLHPIFQGSFEYTVGNTDLNTNTVVNGGTITQSEAMAVVQTSTTTASTALLQTKRHAKYRAGMGGVLRFTMLSGLAVSGAEFYMGLTDEVGISAAFKNGYTIGGDGSVFGFHRFQNDIKFTTAIADWDDPLDGTGPSGMTMDNTKLNVLYLQFEYLGAGAIRVWIEDETTGDKILVHTELYANKNTVPSVDNPNFFHTMWVDNGATTSNIVLKGSSYGYFVEGKTSLIELHQPINTTGLKEKLTVTAETAILTIRNKATYASKTNFIDIMLLRFSGSIEASSANNLGSIRLVKNAALGGTPSYSDINISNSVVEFDVDGTTVTGGTELIPGPLAGKNDKISEVLSDLKILLNPGETLTLAGESDNTATIKAQLLWRELF